MMSKRRSPYLYGAGGCVLGVVFMVCAVAALTVLGPDVILAASPSAGQSVGSFINIGSWLVPLILGLLAYSWAKGREVDEERAGMDDEDGADRAIEKFD